VFHPYSYIIFYFFYDELISWSHVTFLHILYCIVTNSCEVECVKIKELEHFNSKVKLISQLLLNSHILLTSVGEAVLVLSSSAISRRRRQFVIGLYTSLCVRPRTRYLINCFREFRQITTEVYYGTKINWLHFEVKRSKVKVMTIPNNVKNHLLKMHFPAVGPPSNIECLLKI